MKRCALAKKVERLTGSRRTLQKTRMWASLVRNMSNFIRSPIHWGSTNKYQPLDRFTESPETIPPPTIPPPTIPPPTTHWIFRVRSDFTRSSVYKMWGCDSKLSCSKYFIKNVTPGDILWFVHTGKGGKLKSVATFVGLQRRETGPLVAITRTDEELGWSKPFDTEVHYKDLYNIETRNLYSSIRGPLVIRKYNNEHTIDLPKYLNIIRDGNGACSTRTETENKKNV
jgi:hypothetical protein